MKAQPYETLAAAERRILQGGQTGEVMAAWAGPVAGGRYGHPRLMASGVVLRGGERSFVGAVGGSVSVRTHCLITGKWGLNQDVILVIYAQLRFPTSVNLYKLIKSAA